MKIESHILDRDGNCGRCQMKMGGTPLTGDGKREPVIGDRVGLISGLKHTPDAAYLITKTEFDSNRMCFPKGESIP